jgi:hypothetical protein
VAVSMDWEEQQRCRNGEVMVEGTMVTATMVIVCIVKLCIAVSLYRDLGTFDGDFQVRI